MAGREARGDHAGDAIPAAGTAHVHHGGDTVKVNERTLAAAAAALALAVWAVPFRLVGLWVSPVITDLPTYQRIADAIAGGAVPYRDVQIEYPPLATAIFVLADHLPGGYATAFGALMAVCLALTAAGVALCASRLRLDPLHRGVAVAAVVLSPLLLGNVMKTRFDLALAAVLVWMLYAAITERWRTMWVLLVSGILLKLMPVALVPLLIVWQAHRTSRRDALRAAGVALAGGVVAVLPLVILAPAGIWHVVDYHLARPPQIESTAADYMLVLHWLADVPLTVLTSFGSQGLIGDGPRIVAAITTTAGAVLVGVIAWALARGLHRARPGRDARLLVAATAATVAALLATGKVLSPQFMIWLLPATFLVTGRYRIATWALGVGALVLTQGYFPRRYFDLVGLDGTAIALLTLRNAVLICLVAACWPRPSIAGSGPRAPLISRSPDAPDASGPDHAIPRRYIVD